MKRVKLYFFLLFFLINLGWGLLYAQKVEREYLKLGINLYEKKEYYPTINLFKRFIKKYPHSQYREEALYFLGSSYLEVGNFPRARSVLRGLYFEGKKAYLKEDVLYKLILSLRFDDKVKDEFLKMCNLFLEKYPDSQYRKEIEKFISKKNVSQTVDKENKAEEIPTKSEDDIYQAAQKIQISQSLPLDAAYYYLGLDLQQNDSATQAKRVYQIFMKKFPKSKWFYNVKYMLALMFLQESNYQKAFRLLNDVYLHSDSSKLKSNSLYFMAEIALKENKLAQAEQYLSILLKDYSNSSLKKDATFLLAHVYSEKGENKKSAELLKKVVSPPVSHSSKVEVAPSNKMEKKSKTGLKKLLPPQVEEKVKKLLKEKKYRELIKFIDFSMQTYGEIPRFYYLKANIYQLMSNYKKAIYYYEKYLKLEKDVDTYSILAYLYYVMGEYKKAVKYYKKIIKESNDKSKKRDAQYAIEKIQSKI